MNEVAVIGLGNPLMSDEGVGVRLIEKLSALGKDFPGVDFLDLGTSGAKVLHAVAGRRKAIIIDCAFMDEAPGAIVRFAPPDVRSRKKIPRMSVHEGDLMQFIELSRALGECPDEVVIFGIQPDVVALGESLSPALAARTDEYVAAVVAELRNTKDA
jgi:hydrogenase maturation protease